VHNRGLDKTMNPDGSDTYSGTKTLIPRSGFIVTSDSMESTLYSPVNECTTGDTFAIDVNVPSVNRTGLINQQVYNDGYLDDVRWQKAYSKLRRASAIM